MSVKTFPVTSSAICAGTVELYGTITTGSMTVGAPTVDRDDTPLKFDLKLHDNEYRTAKIAGAIKIRAELFSDLIKNAPNKGNADSMKQYLKDYYEAHKSDIDRISGGPPISEDTLKKLPHG
jgi:hypothetical protein